jgi:ribonuclease BN (tRNA processing enzyme)
MEELDGERFRRPFEFSSIEENQHAYCTGVADEDTGAGAEVANKPPSQKRPKHTLLDTERFLDPATQLSVTAVQMDHRVPAVGYVVSNLHGPMLGFTGDTTYSGLAQNAGVWRKCTVLLTECSFLFGDADKAARTKHVCIEDLADHPQLFADSDVHLLVLTHISESYSWRFIQQSVAELELRWRQSVLADGAAEGGSSGRAGCGETSAPAGRRRFPKVVAYGR